MKTKISPATVGMFVMGALALFLIGFLSFGGSNIFKKPARFLVYFDESVSGLDPGAPIKFSGVRIGRVAAVNVRYDAGAKQAVVQTIGEINRNVLTDSEGAMIDLTDPTVFQNLIDRGLRARLSFTGITGLLFIELGIEDPRQYPADPARMTEPLPVVPAIPSPIAEVQSSVVEIVANLQAVDFAALARDLRALLTTTNAKVSQLDVAALAASVRRAAEAVEQFVNSPEAKGALTGLNAAVADARTTLARIDGQVGPVGDDLRKTLADAQTALAKLGDAAATTQRFVQAQGSVGEEVTQSLRQVADAAAALERLADAIGRNPNSLIVGRAKPGPGDKTNESK